MTNSAIVAGEFSHFKHIKTRKVVILEIEINEESFQDAISKLGMPIGGESKPVAIALLDKKIGYKHVLSDEPVKEITEGEKLRLRSVMLCKQEDFYEFLISFRPRLHQNIAKDASMTKEDWCAEWIKYYCNIKSRSELATNFASQYRFKEILEKYKTWQFENNHADNLDRI